MPSEPDSEGYTIEEHVVEVVVAIVRASSQFAYSDPDLRKIRSRL